MDRYRMCRRLREVEDALRDESAELAATTLSGGGAVVQGRADVTNRLLFAVCGYLAVWDADNGASPGDHRVPGEVRY